MEVLRPPELLVDDNDIRKDISSDEFKKAYPNMPDQKNWKDHACFVKMRAYMMARNDTIEYNKRKIEKRP